MAKPRITQDRTHPFWLASVLTAKAIAFERLPPKERAEAAEAQMRVRRSAAERKTSHREHMRRIVRMLEAGNTAAEIGRALGRHVDSIVSFAAARGVFISRSEMAAGYRIQVTVARRATLRAFAARHGTMSDLQILEALVAALLDGDGAVGRFLLRNPEGVRSAVLRAFTGSPQ